jgi:GNAT superfamily N-acetyltransferase
MELDFRIDVSDRLAQNPDISGNPTAYDLYCGDELVGSCAVFDREEPILGNSFEHYEKRGLASINSLFIEPKWRGRGAGFGLLRWVMHYLYTVRGMRYAELDDTSDYMGRPDCIYRKAGFHYDRDDNHMIVNLRHWFVMHKR